MSRFPSAPAPDPDDNPFSPRPCAALETLAPLLAALTLILSIATAGLFACSMAIGIDPFEVLCAAGIVFLRQPALFALPGVFVALAVAGRRSR